MEASVGMAGKEGPIASRPISERRGSETSLARCSRLLDIP